MKALPVVSPQSPSAAAGGCCPPGRKLRPAQTAGTTQLLRALADDTRLQIVALLASAGGPLCVCDIESQFELSQPTISHHLKVLKDADVVTKERRGTWFYYSLVRERLDALGRLHELLGGRP